MNIGIIGAGMIGGTLAALLVRAGHEVWVANSRGPASLQPLLAPLGERAHPATVDEAAVVGDLVIVSVPVVAYPSLPASLLSGKVVIDTGNYYPERDGHLPALDDGSTTSSELLAAELPHATVVKMFNTIYFADLRDHPQPAGSPGRRALPLAGDDPGANERVRNLVDQIGFDTVDAGALAAGRRFGPGTATYNVRMGAGELAGALQSR